MYDLTQNTSEITDILLEQVADYARLQRLTLVGCKAVHGDGVIKLAQTGDLRELALEGVGLEQGTLARLTPYTHHVHALTLTYPKRMEEAPSFFSRLAELTSECERLEALTLYARSGSAPALDGDMDEDEDEDEAPPRPPPRQHLHPVMAAPIASDTTTALVPVANVPENPSLSTAFVRRLVFGRAARSLRKLWVYEMAVSMHQLQILALSQLSDRLEDLVVHLFEADLVRIVSHSGRAAALSVQVYAPLQVAPHVACALRRRLYARRPLAACAALW